MTSTEETLQTSVPRITGQVKWFNNKAGYGFITVNAGEQNGKDIFVHYSAIRVVNSQYKYLVQGEYVEFELEKSTSESHEYQAMNISGINQGQLMCETRHNNMIAQKGETSNTGRNYSIRPNTADTATRRPSQYNRNEDSNGFTKVVKKRPSTNRKPAAAKASA
jgi:cold shock CspA family protein